MMKLCRTTHTHMHRPRQALTARCPAHIDADTDMHTCTSVHTHTQTSAQLPVECSVRFLLGIFFSNCVRCSPEARVHRGLCAVFATSVSL